MSQPDAILLLGPTGAGKTPLGQRLQQRGLWGRPCRHVDFGACLRRAVAAETPPAGLNHNDLAFLRSVLRSGALLEDEQFPIAEALLRDAIAGADDGGWIVLNGLPRHVGQAEDVGRIVSVRAVIELLCPAGVVLERIATNAGGDRAGRQDDDVVAVRRKLALYAQRTAALTGYYAQRGVPVLRLDVAATTSADDLWRQLHARGPGEVAGNAP